MIPVGYFCYKSIPFPLVKTLFKSLIRKKNKMNVKRNLLFYLNQRGRIFAKRIKVNSWKQHALLCILTKERIKLTIVIVS